MQDDLEDQTMTDDEFYEDESRKRKKRSELNSSMMSEGIELEEFAEADTDLTSQEESAFQMRMMMMTKLNMAVKT